MSSLDRSASESGNTWFHMVSSISSMKRYWGLGKGTQVDSTVVLDPFHFIHSSDWFLRLGD